MQGMRRIRCYRRGSRAANTRSRELPEVLRRRGALLDPTSQLLMLKNDWEKNWGRRGGGGAEKAMFISGNWNQNTDLVSSTWMPSSLVGGTVPSYILSVPVKLEFFAALWHNFSELKCVFKLNGL